jgi:hypothetical protein
LTSPPLRILKRSFTFSGSVSGTASPDIFIKKH